jgi:spoIIIJ-associated protein
MNEKLPTIEMIAPTIEEAVYGGLEKLGLTKDEVDIEILDEGNKGLFGLGSRQARVRLTAKKMASHEDHEDFSEQDSGSNEPEPEFEETVIVSADEDNVLEFARNTVAELLDKMKINAEVTARYSDEDEYKGRKPILVDIHGDDLSILIGRKAETLNALQYITSLILGKELGRSTPLSVDVEGYRSRRQQQIRQLANRIAEQVIQTGRRQALEPMPANERRIIHIELRDHPEVYTESMGEGDRRKVVIYPKN